LITKSFIEKQTCLSKKITGLNVSFIVLKRNSSTTTHPSPVLAIPILSFETVEESFGSPTFLFA